MKQIITTIKSTAANFTVDFKKAKAELTERLKKYDVVVTADTLKDAKLMATELNKQATELNGRRKEAVYKVSEPIRAFEADMNHLVQMCKDGREKILKQVSIFEDETRKTCQALLDEKRAELWVRDNVDDAFKSAEFDDLVKLTSLTAKGNLTGKAIAELEHRVNRDKQKQIQTEMRILGLENACYKAGLETPLTEEHVKDFLHADEQTYNTRLQALIHVEKKRQTEAEQRRATKPKPVAPVQEEVVEETVEPKVETESQKVVQSTAAGRVVWNATITFKIETADTVLPERVEARLRRVLEELGITPETLQVNKQ